MVLSAIEFAKNPVFRMSTECVKVQYHFIKKNTRIKKSWSMCETSTGERIIILTKALAENHHG